ncbi:MAG: twin-arginine translocation signal domain-containing protein, partial [bacterium]
MYKLEDKLARAGRSALSLERPSKLDRRDFLKATGMAGGGLLLGIGLPAGGGRRALAQEKKLMVFPPAAFIHIAPDNSVTMLINQLEFGQGVFTSLAMLFVEELDCDWTRVRAEHAPAAQIYAHPQYG